MYRGMLTALGVLLLVLSFPHSSPVIMTNVVRDAFNNSLYFIVTLPFIADRLFFTTPALLLLILGLTTLVAASIPYQALRSAWKSLLTHQGVLWGAFEATALLIITLLPPEPYLLSPGSAVVLYLLVSTFGVLLLLTGVFPLVRKLADNDAFFRIIRNTYEFLRHLVLDSPRMTFLTALALIEFLFASLISHFVLDAVPHVQDSIAQFFHAKIVAAGYLTAPSPPLREFFDYLTVINDGQWYSQYPPGHTFLLAFGVFLGIPWAVNPLLGSLTIVTVYFLGKELYGEITGRLSALLAFLSPFILFMSSEFMNHSSSLLFTTIFVLFFVKSLRTGRFVHGLIAGAAIGWVGCIRPFTAAAVAAPVVLYGLIQFSRGSSELKKPALGFLVSCLVFLGLLLGFNYATNGDALLFGYEKLWGSQVGVGFGKGPWGPPHTLMDGLQQAAMNLNGINKYLFEWPVPSLLFVAFLFFSGRANRWDVLLVSVFASLSLFHVLYWFQDWCFGPRYLFEASSGLVILTARGIERIPTLWQTLIGFSTAGNTIRTTTVCLLFLLFGLGFAVNIPPLIKNYGDKYWDVDGELLAKVKAKEIERAVIFVRGTYGNGFVGNDPLLRNTVIYVRDLGERNKEMMDLYPGCEYYLAADGRLDQLPGLSE